MLHTPKYKFIYKNKLNKLLGSYPNYKGLILFFIVINLTSKLLFFFIVIIGSLITISSSSWIGIWLGLEINLLSFIPLIIDNKNIFSSESAIKYFITQVFASIIFLFTRIFYIIKFNTFFYYYNNNYENLILNSSILLKLGAAPFHFWFPNVIEGLNWINSFIILTWQKIAPLSIISYLNNFYLLNFFIIISALIGSIGGLNQTSLRKIIAFSSINHIRWILLRLFLNNILWNFYFFIYIIINFSIINFFKMINFFNLNQLFLSINNNNLIKYCFLINFISLGGLPPFIGFLPKWLVIENLINKNLFILFFIIIISLITLFFYTRISFSAILINYPSNNWNNFIKNNNKILKINLRINFFIISSIFLIIINIYFIY